MDQTVLLKYEDKTSKEVIEHFISDLGTSTGLKIILLDNVSKRFSTKQDTLNVVFIQHLREDEVTILLDKKGKKLLVYTGSISVRLLLLNRPVVEYNRSIFLRATKYPTMHYMHTRDMFHAIAQELCS